MSRNPADRLDRIASSVAANSTAAKVTGRGVHWEAKLKAAPHHVESDVPLPVRNIAEIKEPNTLALVKKLTGRRFGRMIVLGISQKGAGGSASAKFVVRCACGQYEHRRSKSILNPENKDDCCRACNRLNQIKRDYGRLGSRPLSDFTRKHD